MESTRIWRKAGWFWPLALIFALFNLAAGMLMLLDGDPWRVALYFLTAVVFGLMALQHRWRRTVADERGIRSFESFRPRPDVDLRWDEIATIRRNVAAAWADHVVLVTTKGQEYRLPTVPANDVHLLTEMWQAHRGGGVD